MRRWAWLRLTAVSSRELSEPWQLRPSTLGAADYTRFVMTMSLELRDAFDEYLTAWLPRNRLLVRRQGACDAHPMDNEPIVWAPPRCRPIGADLAPELQVIDLPLLHALVCYAHYTLSHRAAELQRSPRHIRWALSKYPLSTGGGRSEIAWADRILAPKLR